ncbi:MAG: histidine triad nucleotide-binding protein [Bradymonadaceae bacterium]
MAEDENETIFSKIIRGEIPADKVFEDDEFLAFRDINPAAPVHVLIIPKKPIVNLLEAGEDDAPILGRMSVKAGEIAREQGLEESGFRFVINNGAGANQSVFHIHGHILGGRDFAWPPG